MSDKDRWKEDAACIDLDTEFFFDKYEEDVDLRPAIDALCATCPVVRQCFATAVSTKGWGVWGGIYFENGKISREFNKHRSKQDWAEKWTNLTMDREN
jgi:Transcription factor WhiB